MATKEARKVSAKLNKDDALRAKERLTKILQQLNVEEVEVVMTPISHIIYME